MKVIKNYLYNVVYQILILLAPLITVPYVSRVLGPELIGINSYTNSWMTFFMLLGQMGITLYGNREIAYHRDNKANRSKIFWEIEILQTITISLAMAAYLTAVFLFSSTFKIFFLLQVISIIAAGVDVSWYFMGMEDFRKTVLRNMIVKIISVFLILLLVKTPHDLWKYIALLGLSTLVGNLTLWPYLKESVQFVPLRQLRPFSHFYSALLLFIPTITTQIYLVVNRLMLGKISTQNQLGQFENSDKIIKIILAIVTASGQVMLPHIANKFSNGDIKGIRKSLYNSFDFISALAIPMMFGVMAISKPFAPWFLGASFQPVGELMMLEAPVIVLIGWSNVTGTQYLMPVNRTNEYTISVTFGAFVNIVANLFLIYAWGARGATMATVISEFVVSAVQLFYIRNTISRRKLFDSIWKYIVAGLFMFVVVYQIAIMIRMNVINLALEVIVGAVIYLIAIILLKAPITKQAKSLIEQRFKRDAK